MLKDTDKKFEHENFIAEPPARGVETEAMGLENSGTLVKRIFEGASPFAFVREFIQNSLDAGASKIEIGPDFTAVKTAVEMGNTPAYKLMFSDNGEGIARNRMKKLLNKLSSSGRNMDADGNFGIGAKVAALPWNPYGIVFMSWTKENSDGMVRLFRRHDGNYGLFRFNESDDGEQNYTDLTTPPDAYRDSWQKPSGTSVVLLGASAEQDTIFGPSSDEAGLWGIYRVVEDRYFTFPENTKVSVCVLKTQQRDKWPKSRKAADYHQAHGSRWYLDKYSKESGVVKAPGAKIFWWWHPDTKTIGTQGYTSPLGYIGALYSHELYDVVRKTGTGKKKASYPHSLVAMYAKFGLFLEEVWNNVTIVVEPDRYSDTTKSGVAPDLSRGRLRMPNGEPLPWDAWGKAFCEHMPKIIADAIDAAADDSFDQRDFNKKLKEYFDLMDLSSEKDRRRADDGVPRRRAAKKRKGGSAPVRENDGEFKPTRYNIPAISWVRPRDTASNHEADLFQGKAVHYEPSANALLFNEEFPLWQTMVDRWTAQYQVKSGSLSKRVKEGVRYVYQAAVVTRIVHLRKYKGHPDWSAAMMERAMSNESLTVSVLGIHDADRILGNYLKGTIRMKRGAKGGYEAVALDENLSGPQRFVLD